MASTYDRPAGATAAPLPYRDEHVDHLPFGGDEKADRYRTERYPGAVGLNWYAADPTLQFLARYYLTPEELAWAEPHLDGLGAMMGGRVAVLAEETDKNPPRLEQYDRWGHEIGRVILPPSVIEAKQLIFKHRFSNPAIRQDAQRHGVRLDFPGEAFSYLLDQADIGLACAIGTGMGMIQNLVGRYAPPAVRDWVMPKLLSPEWEGSAAQLLTERTGGSDLGHLETTASPDADGESWRINGFKWFVSNVDGEAFVVLAKPEGAPDSVRGVCTFLVLKERRDGRRNGIRIRRLKDKLGTKSVASAEVEFIDAEAFLLSGDPRDAGAASEPSGGDGRGLTRMMAMTNGSRLGVAMMGLGCARRALVESLCYARARSAFGARLIDQPLMRRKLAELIVDVEATQALVFDGYGMPNHQQDHDGRERLRLGAPIVKLKAARLGITAASDAIEVHGGNGYIENWPVARILRDAHVNTIWEGADNILCLDVRRGVEREQADEPLLARIREAVDHGGETPVAALVAERADDLERAIDAWKSLPRETAEARLFPLTQFMGDVYAGALLVEQADWEHRVEGGERKAIVAQLFAERYLGAPDPLRGIANQSDAALNRFDDLVAGALVDDRGPGSA